LRCLRVTAGDGTYVSGFGPDGDTICCDAAHPERVAPSAAVKRRRKGLVRRTSGWRPSAFSTGTIRARCLTIVRGSGSRARSTCDRIAVTGRMAFDVLGGHAREAPVVFARESSYELLSARRNRFDLYAVHLGNFKRPSAGRCAPLWPGEPAKRERWGCMQRSVSRCPVAVNESRGAHIHHGR
jgi:hypothetical protein